MTDPIGHLLDEHRLLMAELAPLRVAMEDLAREGDASLPAVVSALGKVGEMMGDRLLRHARKEDEALFPALESVFGAGSPTAIMRLEHREIHERAALFRETLQQIHEIEHPAIITGGTALRELAHRGGSVRELQEIGGEIVHRLDLHFAKEEEILFPMARDLLSAEEMAEVGRRMAAIEAEEGR